MFNNGKDLMNIRKVVKEKRFPLHLCIHLLLSRSKSSNSDGFGMPLTFEKLNVLFLFQVHVVLQYNLDFALKMQKSNLFFTVWENGHF